MLKGEASYTEKVPDPDEGFTQADMKDMQRAQAIIKVIQGRLAKALGCANEVGDARRAVEQRVLGVRVQVYEGLAPHVIRTGRRCAGHALLAR